MGETSSIAWTDATVSFWWGCTKVGPGCDHCYAEQWDRRVGGAHWGVGVPRRKIASAVKLMHRLDNQYSEWAADAEVARGNARAFGLPVPDMANRRRVFVQSMSDLFDLEVPDEWFHEAWDTCHACDRINLQIVTKRLPAIEKRMAQSARAGWPQHAGLIATVVNQEEADRDVPRLLALKARLNIPWVGLSIEPMLGPITLKPEWLGGEDEVEAQRGVCLSGGSERRGQSSSQADAPTGAGNQAETSGRREAPVDCERLRNQIPSGIQNRARRSVGISWVISGGESKQGKDHQPRTFDLAWARSLRDQCSEAGVSFFMKQLGSNPIDSDRFVDDVPDPKGANPEEWPHGLQVRQFPPQLA